MDNVLTKGTALLLVSQMRYRKLSSDADAKPKVRPYLLVRLFVRSQSGQTVVEYLLLLVVTFITAYIMMTGPLATFTRSMLIGLQQVMTNIVQHGELSTDEIKEGNPRYPSSQERLRAVHL